MVEQHTIPLLKLWPLVGSFLPCEAKSNYAARVLKSSYKIHKFMNMPAYCWVCTFVPL